MQIGLPGGRECDAQVVSHKSSQDSDVARAGNVNYIGAEILHEPENPRVVPQEEKIELVVTIERKLGAAAAQLNSGNRTIRNYLVARARVNQEEFVSVFFRKCGKFPAGIGDTVDFAVRAGKQRQPDIFARHALTSRDTSKARCDSDFSLNVKFRACLTEAFSTMRKTEKICPR